MSRLITGTLLTIAVIGSVVILSRESRFIPGSPITGVLGHFESVDKCDALPPDQLFIITPTEFHAVYDGTWWHGRVEHRRILLGWDRPGWLLRATTEDGRRVELLVEHREDEEDHVGLETVYEETIVPGVGRMNRPRRANNSIYLPCKPAPARQPWLEK